MLSSEDDVVTRKATNKDVYCGHSFISNFYSHIYVSY